MQGWQDAYERGDMEVSHIRARMGGNATQSITGDVGAGPWQGTGATGA